MEDKTITPIEALTNLFKFACEKAGEDISDEDDKNISEWNDKILETLKIYKGMEEKFTSLYLEYQTNLDRLTVAEAHVKDLEEKLKKLKDNANFIELEHPNGDKTIILKSSIFQLSDNSHSVDYSTRNKKYIVDKYYVTEECYKKVRKLVLLIDDEGE